MNDMSVGKAKAAVPKALARSKTLWGVLVMALPQIVQGFGWDVAPAEIDAVVTAAGAILGIWGRLTAKQPLRTPKLPLPVFLILMPLLLLNVIFGLAGCATATRRDPVDLAVIGVTAGVIRNNPGYEPLVGDVIDRIDVLITRGYTNPQYLEEFLTELQDKYGLLLADVSEIRATILKVRATYRLITGEDFPLDFQLDAKATAFLRQVQGALAEGTQWAILFPKR